MSTDGVLTKRMLLTLLSDGPTGLLGRVIGWQGRAKRDSAKFEEKVRAFNHRAKELGVSDAIRDFYWYHTIDLDNGLVTPGIFDFRNVNVIDQFGFPQVMPGMTVLDIGSATGFFAFEFERRGAAVTSVELPSLAQWDMLPGEKDVVLQELREMHNAKSDDELTWKHLHGPFDFCHKMLNSRVRRCFASVYDLSQEILGADNFDMVFFGDVLPHLMSPIQALASAASFCAGTMYVTGSLFRFPLALPVAVYRVQRADSRSWWRLSIRCVENILRDLGFQRVEVMGYHTIAMAPSFRPVRRPVIRASRSRTG